MYICQSGNISQITICFNSPLAIQKSDNTCTLTIIDNEIHRLFENKTHKI